MAAIPSPVQEGAPPTETAPAAPQDGAVKGGFREAGELTIFAIQVLRNLPGTLRYSSEVLRQAALVVRRSSLLLFVMNAFLGFSLATFGFFFFRSIGASDLVGVWTGLMTQRQTGITMFGYVLAGSICCGIAAELGSAKIQQEIDAYESTGVDPMQIIVGARVLAVLLFVPLATVLSISGHFFGTFIDLVFILGGNTTQQIIETTFSVQSLQGYFYAMVTLAALALPCTIVACFYGLRTSGGPAAVGGSVSRALIVNLVLVHVIAAFFGVLFYADALNLPVGD